MQNSVREIASRANPLSFMSRLFNIAPAQWPRVSECWFITFFFKVGAAIGATIITAAFIGRFSISYLPILLIISAVLIILSTSVYEQLIMKVKREILMMSTIFIAAILLFISTLFYETSPYLFFTFIVFAESIFLAQFNILLPILVGDRFTPLESQSTFPFIESGETIGGILGASILGLWGAKLPVVWFMYIWIAFLICSIIVFIVTSFVRTGLPKVPFHTASEGPETHQRHYEIKDVLNSIKTMPFLKSLVVIVVMQWVFMNFLDFQFTKSIEQSVANKPEATIAHIAPAHAYGGASVLTSDEAVTQTPTPTDTHAEADPNRNLTPEQQAHLAENLGKIRSSFHIASLIVQALIATRLIAALGVVGSMIMHPIIMLMSLVGMFLKFGVVSSTLSRMNFEITNVVYKNAYFASHYALPKSIRDQAAQFLEGIARPLGTVIGMGTILLLQLFMGGKELSMWIHIMMVVMMFGVLFVTLRLQEKYTLITREQLFSTLPYPEKLNAIEILAQHGHKNAASILSEKLASPLSTEENAIVRVKILSALGEFSDYRTLPEILDALSDENAEVRLQAATALLSFKDIGETFYSQAFSRYRMIDTLKQTFKKEKYQSVRSAIIRVFSIIKQQEIIQFLIEQLRDENPATRADCIHTLGLFKDPNIAFYILPALKDEEPKVATAAMIALWRFAKYRPMLEERLNQLLNSNDIEDLCMGLYVMGETNHSEHHKLTHYLNNSNPVVAREAAFALTKCGNPAGFMLVLEYLLMLPKQEFDSTRLFLARLKKSVREMVDRIIIHVISSEINVLMQKKHITSIEDIDLPTLDKLRRCYTLIEQHEELFEFENAYANRLAQEQSRI